MSGHSRGGDDKEWIQAENILADITVRIDGMFRSLQEYAKVGKCGAVTH